MDIIMNPREERPTSTTITATTSTTSRQRGRRWLPPFITGNAAASASTASKTNNSSRLQPSPSLPLSPSLPSSPSSPPSLPRGLASSMHNLIFRELPTINLPRIPPAYQLSDADFDPSTFFDGYDGYGGGDNENTEPLVLELTEKCSDCGIPLFDITHVFTYLKKLDLDIRTKLNIGVYRETVRCLISPSSSLSTASSSSSLSTASSSSASSSSSSSSKPSYLLPSSVPTPSCYEDEESRRQGAAEGEDDEDRLPPLYIWVRDEHVQRFMCREFVNSMKEDIPPSEFVEDNVRQMVHAMFMKQTQYVFFTQDIPFTQQQLQQRKEGDMNPDPPHQQLHDSPTATPVIKFFTPANAEMLPFLHRCKDCIHYEGPLFQEIRPHSLIMEAVPAIATKAAELLLEHCEEMPSTSSSNPPLWSNVYDDPPYVVRVVRLRYWEFSSMFAKPKKYLCDCIKACMMEYSRESLELLDRWVDVVIEHNVKTKEAWVSLHLHTPYTLDVEFAEDFGFDDDMGYNF
jgi:hypothetical protein